MPWLELPAAAAGKTVKSRHAVTASVSKLGRNRQRLMLAVRPHLLDGGLVWWRPHARVAVHLGTDRLAGMLRLTPGGPHRLSTAVGRPGATRTAVLIVFGLPGMPAAGHKPEPVEHDWTAEWLEITLPDWARAAPTPGAAASVPPVQPSPFPAEPARVSIMQRVPDPATTRGRATGGPIPEIGNGASAKAGARP